VLLAGDRRVTGGDLKIARRIWEVGVDGWPVTGRRRGRSQHYCGGLDCGLPLVAFWQHNANAQCRKILMTRRILGPTTLTSLTSSLMTS